MDKIQQLIANCGFAHCAIKVSGVFNLYSVLPNIPMIFNLCKHWKRETHL